MENPQRPLLRTVQPLSLYFRPGYGDHTSLLKILASGPPPFRGAVLSAALEDRHEELRLQLSSRSLEAVLDPMAMELAAPGGWERATLRRLTWAGNDMHTPLPIANRGPASLADP